MIRLVSAGARKLSSFLLVAALLTVGIIFWPTEAVAQNPIVVENQHPGTNNYLINGNVGSDSVGQIRAYMSATSVNKGSTIDFKVTVNPVQTYTIDVYRLGWYQGLGGRLMQHIGPISGTQQPTCPIDSTTGLIACNWATGYTLSIPSTWTDGVYLSVLTNAQGYQTYAHFVVRDDSRVAGLMFQLDDNTFAAYNDYPYDNTTGKSLYDFNSYGAKTAGGSIAAVKVSFDRPLAYDGDNAVWGHDVLKNDFNMIRWLEKSGYDVTYTSDTDADISGARLLTFRGVITGTHSEYWSKAMYDNFIVARDHGVNLFFSGADSVYTQIRYENSSSGVARRVLVCYRDPNLDPNTDPTLKTINWRDAPLNRPEQTLVGVQYTNVVGGGPDYIVTNGGNWVYAGTGLTNGTHVTGIVGYEADRLFSNYPGPTAVPGTYTLLASSPFTASNGADTQNTSLYQATSGAWVFATGTIDWAWGLDAFSLSNVTSYVDPRIQQTTSNILNRFLNATPDFSLTASPASQSVIPGGPTSYAVTIQPLLNFAGSVALSLSGLPTGASGSFSPNPATSSSTLSITTAANTTPGTYTLTITGTSGSLTHSTPVTFIVLAPDFSLTASPSTQTVAAGTGTSYSASMTSIAGFSGSVALSVSGLPAGATGTFSPTSISGSGSSTLSVGTAASTPFGTYTLTITGTSGSLTHSTTVSLSVVAPGTSVTFDNKASSGIQFGVTTITTPAFTVGIGLNRAAMIMVAMGSNTATNITASLGGVAATLVPGTDSGTAASIRTMIFQVINPPSGSQTARVSWTGSMNADIGVITVSGANQTTPVTNGAFAASNNSASAAQSVTITSATGDLTASIGYTLDSWKTPYTNRTLKWGIDDGEVGGDIGPGTGTTTHTWTDNYAFQNTAVSGANFKAAGSVPTFSISGTVTTTGAGATVTLSGGASAMATADASGNYSFPNLGNGGYTVTPTKAGYTFNPTSTTLTVSGANLTANFTATANTYTISGTVTATGAGATVTLSGAASATATADASGKYSFPNLTNGSYTVTPTEAGFTFSPTSTTLTVSGANLTANFTATPVFTISGTVTATGAGATVTLSGAASATATADASGNYSFPNLANGSYTITPTEAGFTFSPTSTTLTVNGANLTANFTATPVFTISGTVTATGAGATVTLSGAASATATADASGNYSFPNLVNGSYTVTPTKAGYIFGPTSTTLTVSSANMTANFTATPVFTISGTVTATGAGATVTLSGAASATATADASGNYSFPNLVNGSYTITPTKTGYTFSPTSTTLAVSGANLTANFTATANAYTISGTVTATGAGATVTLSGAASATATADALGNYSFPNLTNGSYTVTPTEAGFKFSPTSTTLTVSGANLTANFTATPVFTISGTVTATGAGATVTLSGAASATATADASGNYSFPNLVNGSYTITPTKTGYVFGPTSTTLTVSGANLTANFTATPVFTISGTVTATGAGATVTLSGAASATATANASGNYSFPNLVNGSYTITPTKAGYIFNPTSTTLTVNGANMTANFTATPVFTISGTVTANGAGATMTLNGAASATATADASGNYSFPNLVNGSYTVTPSKAGFTFSPTSTTLTVNGANMTANFAATAVGTSYTISGTVTVTGAGATVTLSGAASATATADASGNYSFPNLVNGSYTITPTKTGYAFTPVSSTVTVNGANVTVNFTAASTTGVQFDASTKSGFKWGVTTITTPAFTVGSGASRAAMIMVAMSGNTATNITASLGGVAGTLVAGSDTGTTATIRTMIFQVINPPSGSQTATVSWTGSMNGDVGVITVSGADQTTPVINGTFAASNNSLTTTESVTITSNAGDLTASIGFSADAWKTPYTNRTLKWGLDSTEVGGDIGPGTGTTTHTWTERYQFQTLSVSGANFKAK